MATRAVRLVQRCGVPSVTSSEDLTTPSAIMPVHPACPRSSSPFVVHTPPRSTRTAWTALP